jgi:hypothetical protein
MVKIWCAHRAAHGGLLTLQIRVAWKMHVHRRLPAHCRKTVLSPTSYIKMVLFCLALPLQPAARTRFLGELFTHQNYQNYVTFFQIFSDSEGSKYYWHFLQEKWPILAGQFL